MTAERDHSCVWHPFTQMSTWEPLLITAGEGIWLIDEAGRRYLDGVSSLWVNVHGHRRREIDEAIRKQLDLVAHSTLLGLANRPSQQLAERLVAVAPQGLRRVFYSDSGSTAVEVALKMAFQSYRNRGDLGRIRFLALQDAYHGDTLGSVAVGGIDLFHHVFHPLLFQVERVSPRIEAVESAFARFGAELCAFVVEPLVQGAAGMLLQPPGFLRKARELCDRYGVLLIADEVATGFGRTGTLFACEQEGISPDLLCLAKGITGGYLPLAATLATEHVYEAFLGTLQENRTFFHGHSYTGNPLACAAALASLDIFEREQVIVQIQPKITLLGELLAQHVRDLRHVHEIRQRGLMVGIELRRGPEQPYAPEEAIGAQVCRKIREFGVILRPLGPVVVLMPPLSIEEEELRILVDATARAVNAVCGQ